MSNGTPWDKIPAPKSDFTVVRVNEAKGIPIYWGRDTEGHCLLILVLEGDLTTEYRSGFVPLNGVDIDLRNGSMTGEQRLILTLARHIDHDLFLSLCRTLIDSLSVINESGVALAVTFTHLKRWKVFLSGRNAKLLSPEQVRGLFGELSVLRILFQNTLSKAAAISAWCGPEFAHQDFIFGDRAIEVKSLSGKERSAVIISSEDQLESITSNLFLVIQQVVETQTTEQSLSLNSLVSLIDRELTDNHVIDELWNKLANVGYTPLPEYDNPGFTVTGLRCYRVSTDFPKLIRSELPHGITTVSYSINLENIEPFSCPSEIIFART